MPVKKKKRGRSSSKSSKIAEPSVAPVTSKSQEVPVEETSNGSSHTPVGDSKTLGDGQSTKKLTSERFPMKVAPDSSYFPVVVMQCASCRTILADTMSSFLEASERAETISCSSVHNVSLTPDIGTTTSGIHAGCTYNEMCCDHCGDIVGRKFVSTTTQFDSIRGAFTFYKDKLFTHELGVTQAIAAESLKNKVYTGGQVSSKRSRSALGSLEEFFSRTTESMNILWAKMAAVEMENIELRRNFLALERKLQVDDDFRKI